MNRKHNALKRHDDVEELLGTPPTWLIRWGISVIISVIIVLLVGSYFFRYPEIVSSPIIITTEHPAMWLISHTNGRIDSVYVKDQSFVLKNDIIATIENTALTEDALILRKKLEVFNEHIRNKSADSLLLLPRTLNVGELNDAYTQLIRSIDNYVHFNQEKFHKLKIEALLKEKSIKHEYLKYIKRQHESHQAYSEIISKQFSRDSLLYEKAINSEFDLEMTEKEKISNDIRVYQSSSNLSLVELEIHNIEQTIRELNIDFKDKEITYYNNLNISYELLYNKLLEWDKQYVLRSPSIGQISFLKFWSKNQYIYAGDKIFSIIPDDYGAIVGRCYINTSRLGKIKKGQTVMIKLDEYPYMEFGMLKGQVSTVSLMGIEEIKQDNTNRYAVVEVRFDEDILTSTYHQKLEFKGELTGNAEIATKEMSLLEHLINPLKYLWSNIE